MGCPRNGFLFRGVMQYVLSKDELLYRQALPLDLKVKMAERRIEEFINYFGLDSVYVSFSGGIDSRVLLHIARRVEPSVKAVFLDTWMEFPELRQFVNEFDNVDRIKPSMNMKEIASTCGWCFPSKDVSEAVYYARKGKRWAINKLSGLTKDGKYSSYRQQYKKFLPVVDWDIKISPFCCDKQKEEPVAAYEAQTGRHPIVGILAEESGRRTEAYLRTGCNLYDTKRIVDEDTGEVAEEKVQRPISKPIAFFTKQDILRYCVENNLTIAPPYGEIYAEGHCIGQQNIFDDPCPCGKLICSGEQRTGCMFCPVGCHLDNFAKFKRLKEKNRKLYDYCMEELHEKELLEKVQNTFGGNAFS